MSVNAVKEMDCSKEDREIIEIFGAFVVSQMFNQIYDLSCIDKSGKKSSKIESYEQQLILYVENIKSKAGIANMIRKLHQYYNSILKRMDTESAFCRRFALAFVPEYILTDQLALARVVINSIRSIVIRFFGDVRLEFIDHIVNRRSEPGSPRPLQQRFFDLAILHKQLEYKKIVRLGTSTRSGINNEVMSEMSTQIAQMRSEINKLSMENIKLKKVLMMQDKVVKQLKAEKTVHDPWSSARPVVQNTPDLKIQEFNEQLAKRHIVENEIVENKIVEDENVEDEIVEDEIVEDSVKIQTLQIEESIDTEMLEQPLTERFIESEEEPAMMEKPELRRQNAYVEPQVDFDPFGIDQSDVFDL